MYGSETGTEDVERTAFRKAEKKYKLYYDNGRKCDFLIRLAYLGFCLLLLFFPNYSHCGLGKNSRGLWIYQKCWTSSLFQSVMLKMLSFQPEFPSFNAILIGLCSAWKAILVTWFFIFCYLVLAIFIFFYWYNLLFSMIYKEHEKYTRYF